MRELLAIAPRQGLTSHARVRAVPDVDEALRLLETSRPDAIAVTAQDTIEEDVRILRRLREVGTIPTIVIGPDGDLRRAREALLSGAHDYLEASDLDAATLDLAVECAIAHVAAEERRRQEIHASEEAASGIRESRLRQALIDHLSDRLNNPMTVILLQARLLHSVLLGDERDRVERILAAATRMQATVAEVVQAFQARNGDIRVQNEDADLWALHGQAVERVPHSVRWNERGRRIVTRTDPRHVRRIMETLLRKAADLAKDGAVEVSLHGHEGAAVYDVRIPTHRAAEPAALLEAFAGMEDLEAQGDLGLGLYVSRLAAQRLEGEIVARDARPGLLFSLRLPWDGRTRPTLVVVHADPRTRDRCVEHIHEARLDAEVLLARSWGQAQAKLHGIRPDACIIGRPADDDGEDLLRRLESDGHRAVALDDWLASTPVLVSPYDDSTA